MITLDNQTDTQINLELLEQITQKYTKKEVELVIVESQTMQNINKEHRDKDETTDVLSFPLEDFPHFPLGSIVINSTLAKNRANELGHDIKDELTLLFVHGFLHLKGFDHEIDNGEMREEEKKIIEKFNLPNSLIVRTV